MPAPVLKAHQQLDRAVNRYYRPEPFPSDRHRVEQLSPSNDYSWSTPGTRCIFAA